MKFGMIVGFLSPHMAPLADALYEYYGREFFVIETRKITLERKDMGYDKYGERPYLLHKEGANQSHRDLVNEAEVIIFSFGSSDVSLIKKRIVDDKLTLLQSERIFKRGLIKLFDPRFYQVLYLNMRLQYKKNIYLLSLGYYAASDFKHTLFPQERIRRFGYFIESPNLSPNDLLAMKKDEARKKIIWIGRLIDWKRPVDIIYAAQRLEKLIPQLDWTVELVGDGPLLNLCQRIINQLGLQGRVLMTGFQSSEYISSVLTNASILVSTSSKREGWGAVINEGMAHACAVVGTREGGAAMELITDKVNGYLYDCGQIEDLVECLAHCIQNDQSSVQLAGYSTIADLWNPKVAGSRLCSLTEAGSEPNYPSGPLSTLLSK